MTITTRRATLSDVPRLVELVGAYHAFEGIEGTAERREEALRSLLEGEELGFVAMIEEGGVAIGYVAVCFGYSIELGGRDAFVDEMYLEPASRGQGMGHHALKQVLGWCAEAGVRAVHLEVDGNNSQAQELYATAGFALRERFMLMTARLTP